MDPDDYGEMKAPLNQILISAELVDSRRLEVLLHEICHALLIGHAIPTKTEELVCTLLGEGLAALLLNCPNFRSYTHTLLQ